MKSKKEILIKLFISTFYLSAFTFGGGYVIVTLMKKKIQWTNIIGLMKMKCWI